MHQISKHENFNSVQSMSNILPIREQMLKNSVVPGAKEQRAPIFPNIQKYDEVNSSAGGLVSERQIANFTKNLNSSQTMQNSHPLMTQVNSGGLGHQISLAASNLNTPPHGQSVPGLVGKENMTFRGQLESLESVLIDIVSEIKYHRRQIEIIKAEKETSGAVLQMNIV